MSKTPAKISTRPPAKGWARATRRAATHVIASPAMVSWLGVMGRRCARAMARRAMRLTQAWNRVVNTLFLLGGAMWVEPSKRLLVDIDDLVSAPVPRVGRRRHASGGAETGSQARVVG